MVARPRGSSAPSPVVRGSASVRNGKSPSALIVRPLLLVLNLRIALVGRSRWTCRSFFRVDLTLVWVRRRSQVCVALSLHPGNTNQTSPLWSSFDVFDVRKAEPRRNRAAVWSAISSTNLSGSVHRCEVFPGSNPLVLTIAFNTRRFRDRSQNRNSSSPFSWCTENTFGVASVGPIGLFLVSFFADTIRLELISSSRAANDGFRSASSSTRARRFRNALASFFAKGIEVSLRIGTTSGVHVLHYDARE